MPAPRTPKAVPPVVAKPPPARAKHTLKSLAEALGVSRTTVSNAYNRPDNLSKELRERIFAAAREFGYFGPDPRARALRSRELREVGVVFHHDLGYAMSDPSSLLFLRGVCKELDERKLTLQVIPKMGRRLMLAAAFQTTADVLIVHAEIGREFFPDLAAASKPVVLVDASVPGIASVRVDDRQGAFLAMRHALSRDPDVVVVLCFLITEAERLRVLRYRNPPASGYIGSERVAGYAKAVRAAGRPLEHVVWVEVDDQFPDTAFERVAEVRARLPAGARVAIVAMSDRMALAAQRQVKSWRRHKVVSIVGFDDIAEAADAGLTTVRQDHLLKGRLCVQVVLDGLAPPVLPVQLVVRNT